MNRIQSNKMHALLILLAVTLTSACSTMDKMLVRASSPLLEGGLIALNQETDLELAEASIPANISMLEGMIRIDPENETLRTYAAQGYYGLAYGFIEDKQPGRASKLYIRGLNHGLVALASKGITNIKQKTPKELEADLKKMDEDDIAAVFWTASCWAKWIDLNRDSSESIIQLPKPTAMLQRVLEIDEGFYYGSAHMYFGVYYGGRSPMLGGDFEKSQNHFAKARAINENNLLIVDLFQAQYLERQRFDRDAFHKLLTRIVSAPDNLNPELGLLNQIAKRKALLLLSMEDQWF